MYLEEFKDTLPMKDILRLKILKLFLSEKPKITKGSE
jgi:hypothetical protein